MFGRFSKEHSRKNDGDFPLTGTRRSQGFSLIEVLVGITLIAISLLGLAQMFAYTIMINENSNQLSNATFLAQQQVDSLRNQTQEELSAMAAGLIDELLNPNNDGIIDFRRITQILPVENAWQVKVWVFPGELTGFGAAALIADPLTHRVKAEFSTQISR